MALSTPSASTSLCVTNRTTRSRQVQTGQHALARRASTTRSRSSPAPRASKRTMFVCTRSARTVPGGRSLGEPLGQPSGVRVVLREAVDHGLERDDAGRRHHAGLTQRAAEHAAVEPRLLDQCSRDPHTSDPIGAARPLYSEIETMSHGAAYSLAVSSPTPRRR